MSINFSIIKKFFRIFVIYFFFLPVNSAFCAIGYEENTNIMIDTIEEISSIDFASEISYYDFEDGKYFNAFVEFKDNTISGIRIEVKEVETQKNRVFIIDYE